MLFLNGSWAGGGYVFLAENGMRYAIIGFLTLFSKAYIAKALRPATPLFKRVRCGKSD